MSTRLVLAPLLAVAGLAAAFAAVQPAAAAPIGGNGTLGSVARCTVYVYSQTPPYRRCGSWERKSTRFQ